MFCCGLLHRDPFDRILIARSVVNQLPLVTGDTDIRVVASVKVHQSCR
jgi:PIN domain nuclease of toxin-antitoxin system